MKKISIITVSLNAEKYIKDTIESVLSQRLPKGWELEYIIVDGKSTDKTLEIINKYKNKISKVVSEKDEGIYDAMNKGIFLASGEIIGILNSDDVYANTDVLNKVITTFEKDSGVDLVYGDLVFVDPVSGKVVRKWQAGEYKKDYILKGWQAPHPSLFVRKKVYDLCGKFNKKLSIAADYDFIVRVFHYCGLKSVYLPEVLVFMRIGGKSTAHIFNILRANLQCYNSLTSNCVSHTSAFFIIVKKLLYKIKQLKQ